MRQWNKVNHSLVSRVISQSKMDKQLQILQSALQLFVAHGFHGTPTSRIAQEAGVSNGTLFHYYPTKDELIIAVYNWVKNQLNEHISAPQVGSVHQRMQAIYTASIEWALAYPDKFYYIQQVQFSPQLLLVPTETLQAQAQIHYNLIQLGVSQQVFKELPVGLIYTLFSGQVFSVYQYLQTTKAVDQQAVIKQTFELLWNMLA